MNEIVLHRSDGISKNMPADLLKICLNQIHVALDIFPLARESQGKCLASLKGYVLPRLHSAKF